MYKEIDNKYLNMAMIIVGLLIAGSVAFYAWQANTCFDGKVLSADDAADKAVDYINQNFLPQNNQATLKGVTEEKGLYKLDLEIEGQEQETYITKDAEVIFPTAIKATSTETNGDTTSSPQNNTEIPKTEQPKVDLYVMSFCPYGNQAEDTMEPVYSLLKDEVDFNAHYIVNENNGEISSLHGQVEVDQNMREACVKENHGMNKWLEFVTYVNENCGSEGACWQDSAEVANLSVNSIQSCVNQSGNQLMKENAEISSENGVEGSPTMLINGVESTAVYEYGSPEEYKKAICSAFTEETKPEECNQELESLEGSSSNGGSC